MYINFRQLAASDMTPNDLANLLAIRQKDSVMIEAMPEEDAGRYIELGLVEKLKSGVMRLTNKGTSFVNYIETPEMTDEVLETLKIMIGMYESYSKDIGVSRKEAESRLCWFMGNTSFKKEVILQVTESYIAESGDYTMSLCNFIWKPPSQAFSVHMNLKNSKLFDLIAENLRSLPSLIWSLRRIRKWIGCLPYLNCLRRRLKAIRIICLPEVLKQTKSD